MSLLVEVCYARPDQQIILTVEVEVGVTINQAIELSGILEMGLGINLTKNAVGIFGVKRSLGWVVQQHDQIEIYRSLTISPVEVRRLRAAKKAQGLTQINR